MKLGYQIAIAAFVGTLLGGIVYSIHHHGYESGKSETEQAWNLKWAKRDGQDLLELAGRQQHERTEEQRRQNEINQVTTDAQTQIDKARADAANAQSAADRLQLTVANIRRQLAASETGRVSAIANASATKASCQQRVKSDPLTATTNGLILIHLVYSGLASAITPAFRFCFSR